MSLGISLHFMYLCNTFPHSLRFKKANLLFCVCASTMVPEGGGLGCFFLSFGVSGQWGLHAIFKWHDFNIFTGWRWRGIASDAQAVPTWWSGKSNDWRQTLIKRHRSIKRQRQGKGEANKYSPWWHISRVKKNSCKRNGQRGRAKVVKKSQIKGQGK